MTNQFDEIEDFYIYLNPEDSVIVNKGMTNIAYVNDPAIEQIGVYLKSHLYCMTETKKVVPSELEDSLLEFISKCGEKISDSWLLVTEQEMYDNVDLNIIKLSNSVNDLTARDGKGIYRVRYRYTGPKDSKNRTFCARMMEVTGYTVYTEEEIKTQLSNPEFGTYSVYDFKGSYGCRHKWTREIYYESFDENKIKRVRAYNQDVVAAISGLNDQVATTYNANLSKIDNEKKQVLAPLLIPDIKIYREEINEITGEVERRYNIIFPADTIKTIRELAIEKGDLKSKNLFKDTHEGTTVDSHIINEWLVDSYDDEIYSKYGFTKEQIPLGTWMVHSQVNDDRYFENIKKNGKYAYSIEAFLDLMKEEQYKNKVKVDMTEKKEEVKMSTVVIDGVEYILQPVVKEEVEATETKDEELQETESEVEKVEATETKDEKLQETESEEVEATETEKDEVINSETTVNEKTELEAYKEELAIKLEDLYNEIAELKNKLSESETKETDIITEDVKMSAAKAFAKMKF